MGARWRIHRLHRLSSALPKGGYAIAVAGNLSEFDVTSVIAGLQQVITSESED